VNSNDPITAGGISSPFGLAIDGSGNAWVSNSSGSITKLSLNGGSVTGTNFAPAIGLSGPKGLAIDGAGNIWVADSNSGAISEMSSSGAAISPANGYGYCTACNASMGLPFGVAIDGSGDVWMTGYSYGTLTEFVGAATPVVTPLAANLATSSAINKP
jgi:sugar lactone lactonase YvrE